jgi:hypothetical protein
MVAASGQIPMAANTQVIPVTDLVTIRPPPCHGFPPYDGRKYLIFPGWARSAFAQALPGRSACWLEQTTSRPDPGLNCDPAVHVLTKYRKRLTWAQYSRYH